MKSAVKKRPVKKSNAITPSDLFWEYFYYLETEEEAFLTLDPLAGLVGCNPAHRDLFGTNQAGLVPWVIYRNWIHHEDLARVEDAISRILKLSTPENSPVEVVWARVKPNGLRFVEGKFAISCLFCPGSKPCRATVTILFRFDTEEVESASPC